MMPVNPGRMSTVSGVARAVGSDSALTRLREPRVPAALLGTVSTQERASRSIEERVMATVEEAWGRLGKQLAWGIREDNYLQSPAGWLRGELDAEYAAAREVAVAVHAEVERAIPWRELEPGSALLVKDEMKDLRARIEALDKAPREV